MVEHFRQNILSKDPNATGEYITASLAEDVLRSIVGGPGLCASINLPSFRPYLPSMPF